jgi:outer membrane protein assembly factor BamB
VVTDRNRVYSLDANTGAELWSIDNGEPGSALAMNATTLFVAGSGYIRAYARLDGVFLWRTALPGPLIGGPLVDQSSGFVLTQSGTLQLFNVTSGSIIGSANIPSGAGGAPAVSSPWIYIPLQDGQPYGLVDVGP